jgi:hypothetical protein
MISCRLAHLESRCRQRGYTLDEVRPCIVSEDGDQITVDETHPAYPRTPRPASGPGTELKALLAAIGIVASPTCKCNKMARQMDAWGQESLAHMDEIVDVMEETAKARKLPFLRAGAKQLVRLAVWRARKKDIN